MAIQKGGVVKGLSDFGEVSEKRGKGKKAMALRKKKLRPSAREYEESFRGEKIPVIKGKRNWRGEKC